MEKTLIPITESQKNEVKEWIHKNSEFLEDNLIDVQLLILYKLLQIEKRLELMEMQDKTHWVQ